MGAVGEGGVMVVNAEVIQHLHVSEVELSAAAAREREVVVERAQRFRPNRPALSLSGKIAVIVDDGIATGSTARAACAVARALGAARLVLAVPVCAQESARLLAEDVDEFVCLDVPPAFRRRRPGLRRLRGHLRRRGPGTPPRGRAPASRCGGDLPGGAALPRGATAPRRRGHGHRERRPPRRAPHDARARPGRGGLRPRQREQPAQSAQPLRRRRAAVRRARPPSCSTC